MKHIERWKERVSLLQQMRSVAGPDHDPLLGVEIAMAKWNRCYKGLHFHGEKGEGGRGGGGVSMADKEGEGEERWGENASVLQGERGEGAFYLCMRKRGGILAVSSAFTLPIKEACKGDGVGNQEKRITVGIIFAWGKSTGGIGEDGD